MNWNNDKTRGRVLLLCGILFLMILHPFSAWAAEWPSNLQIEAEGGVIMEADTGTVLYEKNSHEAYFPASITKILTALIVIENCSLDEMVTFSHNAVYNVESGSSSAGLDEGDVISVEDCLYALLLKSANEAANALAEHVSGTTEAFAELMNERAASLGCTDSHFANPSGLNNPDHYVSAYDMALIGQAALQNETFMKIDSTLYYDLPATKKNPNGGRIYPGHKMLKKNVSEYYPGCLGGKTGYTSLAGNTLVTFARRGDVTLVTVVLNGHQTHYTDTKAMLDWGFANFQSVSASSIGSSYASLENDMKLGGLIVGNMIGVSVNSDQKLTLPKNGDYTKVTSTVSYEIPASAPEGALALIDYHMEDRKVGSAYVTLNLAEEGEKTHAPGPTPILTTATGAETLAASETKAENEQQNMTIEDTRKPLPAKTLAGLFGTAAGILLIAGIIIWKMHLEKTEQQRMEIRREKRNERLSQRGITPAQFERMLEEKRKTKKSRR